MLEKGVTAKGWHVDEYSEAWAVGHVFAYRSSIWMIQGLFLAPTPSGERTLCFILGKQVKGRTGGGLPQRSTEDSREEPAHYTALIRSK